MLQIKVIAYGFGRSLKLVVLYLLALFKPYSNTLAFFAGCLGAWAVAEAEYTKVESAALYWWLTASFIGYIVSSYFYEKEANAIAARAMEYAYTKEALSKVIGALCLARGADNVKKDTEPPRDA